MNTKLASQNMLNTSKMIKHGSAMARTEKALDFCENSLGLKLPVALHAAKFTDEVSDSVTNSSNKHLEKKVPYQKITNKHTQQSNPKFNG